MATVKKARNPVNSDAEKGARVPVGEIEEVQEFVDLEQEIAHLKAENPEIFMQLADLVDRRNTALERAEKIVRAKGITCGPFENYTAVAKYDAQKMYDELGHDMFLKVGGKIGQVTQYSVDKAQLELSLAQNKIPGECVEQFRSVQKNYHVPDKIKGF